MAVTLVQVLPEQIGSEGLILVPCFVAHPTQVDIALGRARDSNITLHFAPFKNHCFPKTNPSVSIDHGVQYHSSSDEEI